MTRGFVLTPTYRLSRGHPEVHLYGVLESGEPCLVIDDRVRPYFYVPVARAADARRRVPEVSETSLRSFDGAPVSMVRAGVPGDVPSLRRTLEADGIECFEADVRFAYRYLIDRAIRGSFRVDGISTPHPTLGHIFRNPALEPVAWVPKLRVLSLDIETSPRAERVYSVALHGPEIERVLIVYGRPVEGAETLPTEEALLRRFLALLHEHNPDVITGWNVVDFDLAVLQQRCRRHGIRFVIGRGDDELDIRKDASFTRESRAILNGRLVLDGLSLMRGAFIKLEDYKLETAAQAFLGTGKLITGAHRHHEIEAAYRDDPEKLAAYNLVDARLVSDLLAKTQLVELAINRSLLTGMPLDRVSAAIASVDSLYLGEVRRRGMVAPSVAAEAKEARIAGGFVMDSVPGLYANILVFDFKSLYPSIIRTFNLDPISLVSRATTTDDVIVAPNDARFVREPPGILPELVARLAREREQAKRRGDSVGANAVKILMNSMYGVLGAGVSRLFSPEVANAITGFGQHLIQVAAERMRARGYAVIYGDTDSLFVDAHEGDAAEALRLGDTLAAEMTAEVAAYIRERFGCESHLELEFEKLYSRFFLPEVRGGAVGSKKRYAGLLCNGGEHIEFVGLESVRRDWTEVSKRLQHDLLDRVFHDEPVQDYVREFVARLRAGEFDDLLVYKKAVRKNLEAYTKTTPPHVRAARLSAQRGRIVEYVMTSVGPEPVGQTTAALDYAHYIEHQLKPVAQAVLRFLDDDFDDVIGARKQLALF